MASPLKRKPLSYTDVVRFFNELETDLKDACKSLAQSSVHLVQGFDSVATQLHSVDLQAMMPPIKPQLGNHVQEYMALVLQIHTNASTISARIKMFCTVILPLSIRPSTGQSSRSHREKIHVLQSYMTISAEQAALTFQLVERAVKLNSVLSNFHTDIARATSQRASSGQRELPDLVKKIVLLQTNILYIYNNLNLPQRLSITMIFPKCRTCSRTLMVCMYQCTIFDSSSVADSILGARNEVAHAQYATQISHRKSDVLSKARTTVSDLVPIVMVTLEETLSFIMAIWLRLQADCLDIFNWIQSNREPPPCISIYLNGGYTLYSQLASCLDAYVEAIDLQQLSTGTL
ncbi:hypothetical protein C8R43DRAFT_894099 [Mycena crocata]|nr:hypothetical protein C8R43DRAFT_894099 [Mycena crocata]